MIRSGYIQGLVRFQFRSYLDSRGTLVRTFDGAVIANQKVEFSPSYALASVNPVTGTLRGMHFQRGSAAEARMISCVTGSSYNVTIDLRKNSDSFLTIEANELRGGEGQALLVPPGCANGWITLEPNTVLCYQIAGEYRPDAVAGIRFDDPAFSIQWPMAPTVISEADRTWPDFDVRQAGVFER